MSEPKTCYNIDLLNIYIERDGAKNVEIPEKIISMIKIKFICECGNQCDTLFKVIKKYGMKCHDCKKKIGKEKVKKTNLLRLGVEYPSQSKIVKEKVKKTNYERYGVPVSSQCEKVKQKAKETNLAKRGVEYPTQSEIVKEKVKMKNLEKRGVEYPTQCFKVRQKIKEINFEKRGVEYASQSEEVKQKMRETNLAKYRVEYVFQSEEVKQKTRETNLGKYGFEYACQSNDIKQKMRETNLGKYGSEYTLQVSEIRDKAKQFYLKNFGVEHNMQVPEIFEKNRSSSHKFKSYTFPSGKQVLIQGYENYALDKLIESYTEDEIVVGASLVPKIIYKFNNKIKRYFPDIHIPKDNLIIEVKSTYTMENELELNLAKRKACIDQGYDFKFWIFHKGQLIKEINKDEDHI